MNKEIKIMSLEFFAIRFGLTGKKLSYGIVTISDETIPVVSINDEDLFIAITEDKIFPTEILGVRVLECELIETSDAYIFRASDVDEFTISRQEVEEFYANRWFSDDTYQYIRGY